MSLESGSILLPWHPLISFPQTLDLGGIEAWEQNPEKHTREPCELQGGRNMTIPQIQSSHWVIKDSMWLECGGDEQKAGPAQEARGGDRLRLVFS